MANLDVLKILSLGVVGLGFLLALLTYRLLAREQRLTNSPDTKSTPSPDKASAEATYSNGVALAPRESLIRAIYVFMAFSLLLCVLGLVAQVVDKDAASSRRKFELSLLNQGSTLPDELLGTGVAEILTKEDRTVAKRNGMIELRRTRIDEDYAAFTNGFITKYDSPLTHMLIAAMDAARKAVLIQIIENMRRGIDDYSYSDAISDLREYHRAGTVLGSMEAIYGDSRVKIEVARTRMAMLHSVAVVGHPDTKPAPGSQAPARTIQPPPVVMFSEEESAVAIRRFLRPPDGAPSNPVNEENFKKVRDWIERSAVAGIPVATFLTNADLSDLRTKLIRDLNIRN